MRFFSSPPEKKKTPRLYPREWLFISLCIGFFGAITLISHFSQVRHHVRLKGYIPYSERFLEINLQGAVERPGVYRCQPGTPLKKILDQAILRDKANRRKIAFKKILYASQTVVIEEKKGGFTDPEKFSLEEK